MHHLIGLWISSTNYIAQHIHSPIPASLSIWQKLRGMKLYEALKEEKGQMTLLSESLSSNTSGSAPDTAITDNHETDPREKGKDLTQLSPMTTWQPWQHKNATKNFDYTTISDRLRTVSWSNDSYPTGVVKLVYGIPTFPPKRIFRPNAIFLPQCLSWSASFSSSFDFCSKF